MLSYWVYRRLFEIPCDRYFILINRRKYSCIVVFLFEKESLFQRMRFILSILVSIIPESRYGFCFFLYLRNIVFWNEISLILVVICSTSQKGFPFEEKTKWKESINNHEIYLSRRLSLKAWWSCYSALFLIEISNHSNLFQFFDFSRNLEKEWNIRKARLSFWKRKRKIWHDKFYPINWFTKRNVNFNLSRDRRIVDLLFYFQNTRPYEFIQKF